MTMPKYSFALLDPQWGNRAKEANDAVFAAGPVWGIRVRVEAFAERCRVNIESQDTGGESLRPAIELALTHPMPPPGITLATVRPPNLDTVGAMALLSMRADGVPITGRVDERFSEIAEAIRSRSAWHPGDRAGFVSDRQALEAVVANETRPVAERVGAVRIWLEGGTFPGRDEAAAQVRVQREEQLALDHEVWLALAGRVAVITSTSRFAVPVALRRAPVAIAINPEYRSPGRPPYRRVTICQSTPGHVALGMVCEELATIEPGWRGPMPPFDRTRIASTRGRPCDIGLRRLVMAVDRHLLI